MANLHLVTGYAGTPHVTAADEGSLNAAFYGVESYILNRGNKFAATVSSNNSIRILDGDMLLQGRHIRLNEGTYVDLTIENGTQGNFRNDLIVARYTKNSSTGIEECNLVVIKGTATTGTPTDPAYIEGNIIEDHALTADFPLYRVPLNGLNVQPLIPLFTIVNANLADLSGKQDETSTLTAETTIANGDFFPFYDISAGANRKTLWSNLVAKIKAALKIDTSNINDDAVTPTKLDRAYAELSDTKVKADQASASINTKTAAFSLSLADAGTFNQVNSTDAITVTVPANSTVAFPVGTEIEVAQTGTGAVTFTAASGVTIVSLDGALSIAGQYGCAALKKLATDTWLLSGALG